MREPEFRFLDTNGIRLRAVVQGEGPLCVLVHGWPESWYSWRHQIPALSAAGYRVCAIDVRGYGGSDKPPAIEDYDLIQITDDLVGVIDAHGEQQAILIGHDSGAPIDYTTAIRHASRIAAVAGLSVPHLGRGDRSTLALYRERFKDRFFYQLYFQQPGVAERELEADLTATIRKTYYGASGEARLLPQRAFMTNKPADARYLDGMPDPDPLPAWLGAEDVAYYVSQFAESGFRGPLNRYRNQDRDWELLPELSVKKIEQPAVYIVGEEDPVQRFVPGIKLSDFMDRWYGDLREKVFIPNIGHWVQQEAPRETNEALLRFLRSL
jgi:pimeloyl-ACP methyl ester carboxylesterase